MPQQAEHVAIYNAVTAVSEGQDHLQWMHQHITIQGANLQLATSPAGFQKMHCNSVSKLFAHLPTNLTPHLLSKRLRSCPCSQPPSCRTLAQPFHAQLMQPCTLAEVSSGLQHRMAWSPGQT